jgi:hypothetical protein
VSASFCNCCVCVAFSVVHFLICWLLYVCLCHYLWFLCCQVNGFSVGSWKMLCTVSLQDRDVKSTYVATKQLFLIIRYHPHVCLFFILFSLLLLHVSLSLLYHNLTITMLLVCHYNVWMLNASLFCAVCLLCGCLRGVASVRVVQFEPYFQRQFLRS